MTSLNAGTYLGRLSEASLVEIGKNNTPGMELQFELTHIADAGEWLPIQAVIRASVIWLSEKAIDGGMRDLHALGFDGNFDAPRFAEDMYSGVELILEHEMYEGKPQERLQIAKLRRSGGKKLTDASAKQRLAARFRSVATTSARPSIPPPPAPAPAAPAQPVSAAFAHVAAANRLPPAPVDPSNPPF